jgi:hypothetical protein
MTTESDCPHGKPIRFCSLCQRANREPAEPEHVMIEVQAVQNDMLVTRQEKVYTGPPLAVWDCIREPIPEVALLTIPDVRERSTLRLRNAQDIAETLRQVPKQAPPANHPFGDQPGDPSQWCGDGI